MLITFGALNNLIYYSPLLFSNSATADTPTFVYIIRNPLPSTSQQRIHKIEVSYENFNGSNSYTEVIYGIVRDNDFINALIVEKNGEYLSQICGGREVRILQSNDIGFRVQALSGSYITLYTNHHKAIGSFTVANQDLIVSQPPNGTMVISNSPIINNL